MMLSSIETEGPIVEISTSAFTAYAKNIQQLPYRILMANISALQNGAADIATTMVAMEALMGAALEPKDFKRFTELTLAQATEVFTDWVNPLSGI